MVPYGGFWWRVLAYFIDYAVINIVLTILSAVLGVGLSVQSMIPGMGGDMVGAALLVGYSVGCLIAMWLYYALMESSPLQGTLGKMAVGLVVTDENGQRISFLRATGRYFAKILSAVVLCIGFIMVAFTERKQGLHDMIARTLVYKTRDPGLVAMDERVFA